MELDNKTKLFLNASIEEVLKKQISETLNPKIRENPESESKSSERPLNESEFLEIQKMISEDARTAFDQYIEKLKRKTPDQVPLISKIAKSLSESGFDPIFACSSFAKPIDGKNPNVNPIVGEKTQNQKPTQMDDPEKINQLAGENLFADFSEINSDVEEIDDECNKTIVPPLNVASPQPDGDLIQKCTDQLKIKFDDWVKNSIKEFTLVSGNDLKQVVEGIIKQTLTTKNVEDILRKELLPETGLIRAAIDKEFKKTNVYVEEKINKFERTQGELEKEVSTRRDREMFTNCSVEHLMRQSRHKEFDNALRHEGWSNLRRICFIYRNIENGPLTKGDLEWATNFFKLKTLEKTQLENLAAQMFQLINNLVEDLNGINNVQIRAIKNQFDLLKTLLKRLGLQDTQRAIDLREVSFSGIVTPKDGAKILKKILPRYTRFSTKNFFKQTETDEIRLSQVVVPLVSAGPSNPISSDSEDESEEKDFFGNTPPPSEKVIKVYYIVPHVLN